MGYRRNALAHGLTRNLLDTIGVVTDINGAELNLYFLEIFYGILETASVYRQNTTVLSIGDWQRDSDRILQFFDGRVDGIIFIAPEMLPASLFESFPYHTPFVSIHSNVRQKELTDIDIDDEDGACCIVRHLIEQGHRRIAHFTGTPDVRGAQLRLKGYCRAMQEAGIPADDTLIVPCSYSLSAGRSRTEQFLAETPPDHLPTAIFCGNDTLAYGCMEVLTAHGIRIPEQISVAGFDDSLMARLTVPALTTIRQPFRRMGQRAVERLLPKIRNDITLETEQTRMSRLSTKSQKWIPKSFLSNSLYAILSKRLHRNTAALDMGAAVLRDADKSYTAPVVFLLFLGVASAASAACCSAWRRRLKGSRKTILR